MPFGSAHTQVLAEVAVDTDQKRNRQKQLLTVMKQTTEEKDMRTEVQHVTQVLHLHGVQILPFDVVKRLVALFLERTKDNDSLYAFINRDDFIHIINETLIQHQIQLPQNFAQELFASLVDVTILNRANGEIGEYHELLDIQLLVILFMLLISNTDDQSSTISSDRELSLFNITRGVEHGNYFHLEKALAAIIFYSTEVSQTQALSMSKSIVQLLQETYLSNTKRNEEQEKKKNDKKRVKTMWDKVEDIDLDKKSILKSILLATAYIPSTYKPCILNTQQKTLIRASNTSGEVDNSDIPSKKKHNYKPETRPPPMHKLEDYKLKTLSGKHRKRQRRYPKLDVYAMNTIKQDELDLQTLVSRLVGLARNDEEKTRVFFKWITYNIEFTPSIASSAADQVFNSRKASSEGFARLFTTLCEMASVQAETIMGTTRDRSLGTTEEHYWNSVVIDNNRYFVDCALASGVFDGERHIRMLRNYYFLVPPESFIDNHFPEDASKQYLKDPIPFETYSNQNELLYRGSELGVTLQNMTIKTPDIELKNANTVRMQFVGDDVEYKIVLRDADTGEEAGSGSVELFNEKKRKFKVRARIPEAQPKKYVMELLAREKVELPEDDEEDEASDDDEAQDTEKPKEAEPEFEVLLRWSVSKIIDKKPEQPSPEDEDGREEEDGGEEEHDEDEDGEENGEEEEDDDDADN